MSLPFWICSGGNRQQGWRRRCCPPPCGRLRAASRRSRWRHSPQWRPDRPWWSWSSISTRHCPSPQRWRSSRRSLWTHPPRRRWSCRPRRGCSSWGRSWCRRGRWRRRTGCRRRLCSSAWPHRPSWPLYSPGSDNQLKIERGQYYYLYPSDGYIMLRNWQQMRCHQVNVLCGYQCIKYLLCVWELYFMISHLIMRMKTNNTMPFPLQLISWLPQAEAWQSKSKPNSVY